MRTRVKKSNNTMIMNDDDTVIWYILYHCFTDSSGEGF